LSGCPKTADEQPNALKPTAAWNGLAGLLELRSRLHAWAQEDPRIHAAVAFGSTERTDRPADAWSDLDLLFVVDDEASWLGDLGWVEAITSSWIGLVNEAPIPDVHVVQVLFTGGYDVDLIPITRKHLAVIRNPDVAAELFGHGFRVVFDRIGAFDGLTEADGGVPAVTDSGVRPPSAKAFEEVVATFLYQTVWATKRLLRGERWRAHDDVDDYMRDRLLTMLEWHALSLGVDGVFPESRKLEAWIPPRVAAELPATFAQYEDASIAQALIRGHGLFRQLAREVAARSDFTYPEDADAEIEAWVRARLAESPLGAGA
jgi:aminoglycoside 6-adenylyltransferase